MISARFAQELYGVILDADGNAADMAATEKARTALLDERKATVG